MSSDNFHLVFQYPNGKWICLPNKSMSHWQEQMVVAEYKVALKIVLPTEDRMPMYDTLDEALEAADGEGYSEYGEIVIQHEDWFD